MSDDTNPTLIIRVSATESSVGRLPGPNQELIQHLERIQQLVDTVKGNMKTDPLEEVIASLRRYREQEIHVAKSKSPALRLLVLALLTRYTRYGWVLDMEESHRSLKILDNVDFAIPMRYLSVEDGSEGGETLSLALAIINNCRDTIESDVLDEAISLAEAALPHADAATGQRAQILLSLGNALVMRYLLRREPIALDQAFVKFSEGKDLCQQGSPTRYIFFLSIGHAQGLKFVEEGRLDELNAMRVHLKQAGDEDQEAINAFWTGERILNGDVSRIDEAVSLLAISLSRRMSPHSRRAQSLSMLAIALWTRFNRRGDAEDLNQAIAHHIEALSLMPALHVNRPAALNNLSAALMTRFEIAGDIQDLEKGISIFRQALELRPPGHPLHFSTLNNLANALQDQFEHDDNLKTLEECISCHREALELRPISNQDRASSLTNLANALFYRFGKQGNLQDLDYCVSYHKESIAATGAVEKNAYRSLQGLATALRVQFQQRGDISDLDECITLHEEALAHRPPSHPLHALSTTNLANALEERFRYSKNLKDLEKAIACHEEELALTPSPHPSRPSALVNLASVLLTRFRHLGEIPYLEQCISCYDELLPLVDSRHRLRALTLTTFSSALIYRFEVTKDITDLEIAVSLLREAIELRPAPHPLRSTSLATLADVLYHRFVFQGEHGDLEDSLMLSEEASKYETGSLVGRFETAQLWAQRARDHLPALAISAFQSAINLLPSLAALDLTLEQRRNVLSRVKNLASDAASCAIEQNQVESAVVFLSLGRSIFWSQALQLRTSVDQLADVRPDLAQQLRTVSRQLEVASYSEREAFNRDLLKPPKMFPNEPSPVGLRSLASQRSEVLEEIRRIGGFEDFMLPPSIDSLRDSARNGSIILLNAGSSSCHALILTVNEPLLHVLLPKIQYNGLGRLKEAFRVLVHGGALNDKAIQNLTNSLHRDVYRESPLESDSTRASFRMILELLWTTVVEPVIRALGLEKTSSPPRIWWCPTGLFCFLPIHAAGIYLDDGDGECLSDYAVTSYCSTPQDLILPTAETSSDFKILAIIEPEAPDGDPLPKTVDELAKIQARVPYGKNLTSQVGSRSSPLSVDNVLANMKDSTFVHFGCHGMQDLNDPLKSFLLLSGGKLTISRIIRECQMSSASLAYLSACNTAQGDEDRPDESLNLVATMMFAGFRSVVGTMSSIYDEDAPIVADIFYSHMFRRGTTVAPDVRDAAYGLHLAVKELRSRGKSFQHWVPFVHFGI